MMKRKRVWVDVTLMMLWRGSFTGIQRVVYAYLERFKDDPGYDIRLFISEGPNFKEVLFAQLEESLKQPELKNSLKRRTLKQRIKSLPNDVVAYSMPVIKKQVKTIPYLGNASASAYKSVRSIYRNVRSVRSSEEDITTPFEKNDTVLLIDGNWSDKNEFAQRLVRAKRAINFKLVHIVHDIIAIRNPAYAARQATLVIGGYFKTILPAVDQLYAISKSTMKDVEEYCISQKIKLTDNRRLIRLGDAIDSRSSTDKTTGAVKPELLDDSENFILSVGTVEVRKNHHLLYYVYKMAHELKVDLPQVVIVGRKGWMSDETMDVIKNDSDIKNKFLILNHASDGELRWLYEHCQLTVFPSFYEGWGLPVVEALGYGKYSVVSNASSLPEAGGNMVGYASPNDPREFLHALQSSLDPRYLKEKETYIKKNYKLYTWDDSYASLKTDLI